MKKTHLILLLAAAVCLMAACNSGENESKPEPVSTEVSGNTAEHTPTGYLFESNGVTFGVGSASADVIDKLGAQTGEPYTSNSCAFNGKDTVYYFGSFEVSANDETGDFVIYSVYLKDDSVSTKEGAYIGMTPEEVKAIYGEPAESSDGGFSYVKEGMKLNFFLKDGAVSAISYYVNN
ncbi:MAG: hypothetical protein J6T77_01140 [Clostridia bacterium]|nr:hypothetical protein [Clostridia bacterium]